MYRLLIVDDEKQIRDGLKKMISWEEYGIEICGEAANGLEALELIRIHTPQIILMDIQMPEMDGIELAKVLFQEYPSCKFVVLSGYSDFALVRQAMKYGAVDYLLKPSGKDEIIQIIEEIIDNLEDEIVSQLKNNEHMKLLKNNVLNRIIAGTISSHEMREKLELLEMNLKNGPYTVALLTLNEVVDMVEADYEIPLIVRATVICEKILNDTGKGFVFTDSAGRVGILIKEYSGWKKDFQLQKLLDTCVKTIGNELDTDAAIVVGSQENTIRKLSLSYKNAVHSLMYKGAFGEYEILYYDKISQYFSDTTNNIDLEKMKELIRDGDSREVYLAVNHVLDQMMDSYEMKEQKSSVGTENEYTVQEDTRLLNQMKSTALEIMFLAYQCLEEISVQEHDRLLEEKNRTCREIMLQNTAEGIKTTVLRILECHLDVLSGNHEKNMSKLVSDTIRYVDMNYHDPNLSLPYLAEKYHTNTAYLGRIFKKETGSSFADYLNIYRVKQAEKLLMTTNYKGVELSQKVGFSSYNYFYIVFKKVMGKRPMDVRKI